MSNNSILHLANWEVDKLGKEQGFLIRPVEPQPLGISKDSGLDGKWLAKKFKVNEVPLLLPTIGDLPMEFPWGRVGEILPISDKSLQLVITSVDVEKLNQISLIAAKPGGTEFLSRLDGGQSITSDELLQYFNPQEQEDLFRSDATMLVARAANTIDPQSGQPFTGSRLIERVGQMHFGGDSIPIDARASDVFGQLTVKSYGQKTRANYEQALRSMGCQ